MGVKRDDPSFSHLQDKASKIKKSGQAANLALDFFMVFLILFNLSWIFFDTLFDSQLIQQLTEGISPVFYQFYATEVHPDFLRFDLYFVALYLLDIVIRWAVAIWKKTYHRWFFFPFVHWYDVLGCIPIGSFHLLRLLRVFVILKRLQLAGVLDLSSTYIYRTFRKYMGILTEEISDRVVVHVLNGMQEEVSHGTPLVQRIVQEVLLTRRLEISCWVSNRLTDLVETSFEQRREEIRSLIHDLVQEASQRSDEINRLQLVPIFGPKAQSLLEDSITSMVFEITEQIMEYFRSEKSTELVQETTDVFFNALSDPNNRLNLALQTTMLDALELLKDQVKIQQWKAEHH